MELTPIFEELKAQMNAPLRPDPIYTVHPSDGSKPISAEEITAIEDARQFEPRPAPIIARRKPVTPKRWDR